MSRPGQLYRGRNSIIQRRRTSILHDDGVAFPILDTGEITHVLQTCNFEVLEDMIVKPNGQFMRYLIENVLHLFTSTSLGSVDKKISALSNKTRQNSATNGGNAADANSDQPINEANGGMTEDEDTIPSLASVVLVRKAAEFFQALGVPDFSLIDMVRPDPYRTRRILSALINFIKFRDTRVADVEDVITEAMEEDQELKRLKNSNTELSNRIDSLQEKLTSTVDENGEEKPSLKGISVFNTKVENELRKLKRIQENLTAEHSQYKQEKAGLIKNLEDINYVMYNQTNQIDTLKSYDQVDIESLNALITQFQTDYEASVEKVAELENHNRNISITIDSFDQVENDLKNLSRILEEVLHDFERYHQVNYTLSRIQESLEHAKFESDELARSIQQFTRQIENLEEKINKVNSQSEARTKESEQKLNELKVKHEEAIKERNEKDKKLQLVRDSISEIQNGMKKNKADLETEISNTEMAVARLNSHLKVYLTEMNKKIS